jgi:hypothetical protein
MPIEDRNLLAGTRLVATHKKQAYVCTVEVSADGERNEFVLEDGQRFKSPSAAGTAVIGTACNGWRFWSVEGASPAPTAAAPARSPKRKAAAKGVKVFYRSPNQRGLEQGQTRYYCNACAAGFVADAAAFAGMPVDACPNGHSNDDQELTSAPDSDVAAADKAEGTVE